MSAFLFILDLQREKMHHAQTLLTSTNIFIDLANFTLLIIISVKLTNEIELQIGLNCHELFSSCENERSLSGRSISCDGKASRPFFCFLLYIGIHNKQTRLSRSETKRKKYPN